MSRSAVVIPFPARKRRRSFTLSAFSADRARFERSASLLYASYVAAGVAIIGVLQLYATR